jgi:hypothetical protein
MAPPHPAILAILTYDPAMDREHRGSRRGGDRARIDARRVKGGLKPTPAMPGMGRLWGLATT